VKKKLVECYKIQQNAVRIRYGGYYYRTCSCTNVYFDFYG